jgi:hypothetical protein
LEFKSKDFSDDDEEDGKNVVVAAVDWNPQSSKSLKILTITHFNYSQ